VSSSILHDYIVPNPIRFGLFFSKRVANPKDILFLTKRRRMKNATQNRSAGQGKDDGVNNASNTFSSFEGSNDGEHVENLISHFLQSQRLQMLPENEFTDCLRRSIERDDRETIHSFVKTSLNRTLSMMTRSSGQKEAAIPSTSNGKAHKIISSATLSLEVSLERDALLQEFSRMRIMREQEWSRLHNLPGGGERLQPNNSIVRGTAFSTSTPLDRFTNSISNENLEPGFNLTNELNKSDGEESKVNLNLSGAGGAGAGVGVGVGAKSKAAADRGRRSGGRGGLKRLPSYFPPLPIDTEPTDDSIYTTLSVAKHAKGGHYK
jgi:hypothetical protein